MKSSGFSVVFIFFLFVKDKFTREVKETQARTKHWSKLWWEPLKTFPYVAKHTSVSLLNQITVQQIIKLYDIISLHYRTSYDSQTTLCLTSTFFPWYKPGAKLVIKFPRIWTRLSLLLLTFLKTTNLPYVILLSLAILIFLKTKIESNWQASHPSLLHIWHEKNAHHMSLSHSLRHLWTLLVSSLHQEAGVS